MIIMADTSSAGAAGDVVLNWEIGATETSSGVMYAVYNAANAAHDSATPTGASSGLAVTLTATLNVPDNGLVTAGSFAGCHVPTYAAWSAWEGVNEDKEQNTGTFYLGGVGASKLYPNGNNGAPVEISTVATCGSVSGSLAAISLAPAK